MRINSLTPLYVEFMPEVLDEGVLYISHQFGSVIHLCACGCGVKTVTPISPSWPGNWTLTEDGEKVTIRPSILNSWCNSHYFVTDSKIDWLP